LHQARYPISSPSRWRRYHQSFVNLRFDRRAGCSAEPIYGYDGLPPDQVIANVQGALQRLGYYRYAVNGVLGPLTRAAIANYQCDYGLAATGAIDPQTLTSLSFIA
jgi:hypothetical protein